MAKTKDFFALTYGLQCPQYLERSYIGHNGPQVLVLNLHSTVHILLPKCIKYTTILLVVVVVHVIAA